MAPKHKKTSKENLALKRGKPLTNDFFVFPHIGWMIAVPFGLCLLFIATFSPDSALRYIPWPLCDFVYYMGKQHSQTCILICVFTAVIHSVEAAYAGKICQDKQMAPISTAKWTFQTFLFGFPSLMRLRAHKPSVKMQ